ncbi:MAG: thiamine ABC transporter substrate-binding protein [Spirochaetales bacterium]|nr:thiamine ABC transporter substrate-binding protein [Spirochaetales bacterium]
MNFPSIAAPRRGGAIASMLSFSLIVLVAGLALVSCSPKEPQSLQVWTYDSFVSEWGPGARLAELFEEKSGIKVSFVSKGDGGALLAALVSAGKDAQADLVLGLDNNSMAKALNTGLFAPARLSNTDKLRPDLLIDPSLKLLPYDFGDFAIIWDSESGIRAPTSLEDLTDPYYAKRLIIMDPRSSTPGLGLLAWTQAVYGQEWKEYWSRLKPSVLTMTPGWDTGYGIFTKGEAPLVLSYSTSPAYHKAYEDSERYKALVFTEGHAAQVELAGILDSSKRKKDAEKFLDFLISAEAQALLPETQWMYPVNVETRLPDSFAVVPQDIRTIQAEIADPDRDPEIAAEILTSAAG